MQIWLSKTRRDVRAGAVERCGMDSRRSLAAIGGGGRDATPSSRWASANGSVMPFSVPASLVLNSVARGPKNVSSKVSTPSEN